jgi:hypothetical protein
MLWSADTTPGTPMTWFFDTTILLLFFSLFMTAVLMVRVPKERLLVDTLYTVREFLFTAVVGISAYHAFVGQTPVWLLLTTWFMLLLSSLASLFAIVYIYWRDGNIWFHHEVTHHGTAHSRPSE